MVGSGLAALIAARTLQQAGRQPLLIWPGLTSLYFVYATIDVLGYRDAASRQAIENPGQGVTELISGDPHHPYALAGLDALGEGIALFLEWVRTSRLPWQGSLDHNYLLPTAIGAAKPACLVPASMAAGELRRRERILLCGFDGYEDFVPEMAASTLSATAADDVPPVTATRVRLPGFEPGRLFSSIDIARGFEDNAFRDQVAERIRQALPAGPCRVGLPAVLGMTHHPEVHADLEDRVGQPLFEIPTVPPSIPGLRLFDRLRKQLQESGVEILADAPAHAAELVDGRCRRIAVKSAGRDQPVEATAFVLAIEDAVDGAWQAGVHRVRDPFFDQTLAATAAPAERSTETLFESQPFAGFGYAVNHRLQPLRPDGAPIAENVFIAGGGIARYDPAGTRSRGGLAIATGYRAAKEAMLA